MTTHPAAGDPAPDLLAPVRAALLTRADADARAELAAADAEAGDLLARARTEAGAVRDAARTEGRADGAALAAAERARARREARAVVLAAQREAYENLLARVRAALPELRADPAYPAWRERAVARVGGVLGPDAVVADIPTGGVVGHAPGRSAAASLTDLADRAAAAADADGLWTP
ncbi:hypothetical protein [Georgenia satyanarayanai]|uniref:hypothetical protein n=1 Tax=Georgenia satyanarayanai TaxID=860221 RepID=UPI001265761C|nr:hypothetical protein [Georgenia satyanarayanai]